MEFAEKLLLENNLIKEGTLQDLDNMALNHNIIQALRAHKLFIRDKDYILKDKQVVIIDDLSGRPMEGRRYGDGLHQAIEAKEGLTIQKENQTIASVTYQNFFRSYSKLSGMTGTAQTEANEFEGIYNLAVVSIPPNLKINRDDQNDQIYMTKKEKYDAVINLVKERHDKLQPILIGTTSVENSELISKMLKSKNINHSILNAKHHEKEAEIIANAGKPGMVTIATNMAGRGTDIVLGGKKEDQNGEEWKDNNEKVLLSGGLHILGTERHESRRIDNQLRGRSGRQGDPGYSRFFLSLEDDLLRLFISDSRRALFDKIGMGDDHIEHRMLSRGIENAQKRIESKNFDARKSLLEYDDVSNDQRQAIYSLRNQLLEEEDISETINNLIEDQFNIVTNSFVPVESVESQWKTKELENHLTDTYSLETNIAQKISEDKKLIPETIVSLVTDMAKNKYADKYKDIINLVCGIIFLLPVCVIITIYSFDLINMSWDIKETSTEPGGLKYVYIQKTFIYLFPLTR